MGAPPAPRPAQLAAAQGEGGGEGGPTLTVSGLPLLKPPYGRISAIDLNNGEIAWQIAHGETPDSIRNHPALKGLNIPRTGRPGNSRAKATAATRGTVRTRKARREGMGNSSKKWSR